MTREKSGKCPGKERDFQRSTPFIRIEKLFLVLHRILLRLSLTILTMKGQAFKVLIVSLTIDVVQEDFTWESCLPSVDVDTLVIGGGIAGLACAAHLKRNGQSVRLCERQGHLGGVIRTLRESGYQIETGPNSLFLRAEDPLLEYLSYLNIAQQAIPAGETGKKRFVLFKGKPVALPTSLTEGITTPLLSWKGKLRLIQELWVPPLEDEKEEESVAQFVSRRFGPDFLNYFIDPFVKGIYASKPEILSMEATFPRLVAMEDRYGSIIKAGVALMMAPKKSPSPLTKTIFSFQEGMGFLPAALSNFLDTDAGTNAEVTGCTRTDHGYRVSLLFDDETYYVTSRQIVLAGSASLSAELLSELCPKASLALSRIPYAPIAVIYMGFRRKNISHPLDGFGLLVPELEKKKILGILFSSSLFPSRAPDDHVLLTIFVGGMQNPKLAYAFDEDLLEIVKAEVQSILETSGNPDFLRIQRWEEAIPQYTKGHIERINEIRQALPRNMHLAGAYLDGVSVSQSFTSGIEAAKAVLQANDDPGLQEAPPHTGTPAT